MTSNNRMRLTLNVCQILVFISFFLLTSQELITVKTAKYESAFPAESSGLISCSCDGWNTFKTLLKNELDEISSHLLGSEFCTHNFRAEVCDFVTGCSMCAVKISKCNVDSNGAYRCVQNEITIHGSNRTVNRDGFQSRVKRTSENCHFPTNMKTSNLHCVESPKEIKCVQRCTYGYTLQEGISRRISCKFSENKWKPYEFEECSPFIDCTMTLVGPGSLFCKTGTPDIPPQCDVSCGHYEDNPPVPLTTYHCSTASSGWTKKLPHCVSSGTAGKYRCRKNQENGHVICRTNEEFRCLAVYLVPEPREKLHSDDNGLESKINYRARGHRMKAFHNRRRKLMHPRMLKRKKQRKPFEM